MNQPPKRIRINRDDYLASLVGKASDSRQFFITQPFVPGRNDYVARYLFDGNGDFVEAKVHDLGERVSTEPPGNALMENSDAGTLQNQLLDELGDVHLCDINVCPFSYEALGIIFGLIAQPLGDVGDGWSVNAQPGDYMAFLPPWDGEYYT